jgi:N-terminal acetyltransferase B complex non-catalytic subunit
LAVLDATFTGSDSSAKVEKARELFEKVASEDGDKDRSGLLALLELERREREVGASSGMQGLGP